MPDIILSNLLMRKEKKQKVGERENFSLRLRSLNSSIDFNRDVVDFKRKRKKLLRSNLKRLTKI
ncbi:hypothetical protein QR98_0001250 [Sarcoptes scabiei]|uniref:Uncharacterized protein n=1 Tax=Sarcoptes scabiei TaxID=52283 RepID=A0A131ZSM7_SARSC|nr:hypothetical protein QR98_0001250 [Sarcoptes scabiei]